MVWFPINTDSEGEVRRAALRRLVVVLGVAMLLLGSIPGALSATGTGTILVGHPLTTSFSSTEWDFARRNDCNPAGLSSQGLDAWVVDAGSDTHIRVTGSSGTSGVYAISFNIAFYDALCNYIGSNFLWNGGPDVYKSMAGTKWAVISLWSGANANITWKTCTPFVSPFTSCY